MIESAYVLPLEPSLPPWNETNSHAQSQYVPPRLDGAAVATTFVVPGSVPVGAMVDLDTPLNAESYATVDRMLAYRDLVNAADVTKIVTTTNDIWGFKPSEINNTGPVDTAIADLGADWPLSYVDTNSIPADALSIDTQLAKRDGIISFALARLSQESFAWYSNPIPPPSSQTADDSDLWATAQGSKTGRLPSNCDKISPLLFTSADRVLAWRDNVLAAHTVELQRKLRSFYESATRMCVYDGAKLVQCTLESEDNLLRIFATYPSISGQRKLVYNKQQSDYYFTGSGDQESSQLETSLYFPSIVVNSTASLNGITALLAITSSLNASDQRNVVIFRTSRLYDYALELELAQPNYLLLPASGEWVTLSVPAPFTVGNYRIGVGFSTTRTLVISGAANTLRSVIDSTSYAEVVPGQSLDYSFAVPVGQLSISALLTSLQGSYACTLRFNGQAIFSGSVNAAVGAQSYTPPSQVTSPGGICTITFTLDSGIVRLEALQLTVAGVGQISSTIRLETIQPDGTPTLIGEVNIATIPDSLECAIFDARFDTTTLGATLRITHVSAEGCGLRLYQLDARRVEGVKFDPNIDGAKSDLLRRAADAARKAYSSIVPQFETSVVTGRWGKADYAYWVSLTNQGAALDTAFPLAGPGDIGRPALVPRGLVLTDTGPSLTLGALQAQPRLQPLQPWMLALDVRVAAQAFVPPRPSKYVGPAYAGTGPLRAANLRIIPCECCVSVVPHIINIFGQVYSAGGAYTGYEAMSIPNAGAAGGYEVYTLRIILTIYNMAELLTDARDVGSVDVDVPSTADYPWLTPEQLALLLALGAFGTYSGKKTKLIQVKATYIITTLATGNQTILQAWYQVPPIGCTVILPDFVTENGTLAELQSVNDLTVAIPGQACPARIIS